MPSSRYYRFKTASREERERKTRALIFWGVFTAGLIAIIWMLFISPLLKITEIRVPESDVVTKEKIGELIAGNLPFKMGENLLLLSSARLKTDLAAVFPTITNLKIRKELLNTLAVNFEKRVQVGFWCNESNCYSFDKDGIIFKEAPASEGSLILKIKDFDKKLVLIGDKILDDDRLSFIFSFYDAVEKTDNFKITEFKIKPASDIDLEAVVNNDWAIYLDPAQNPEAEASNLFTVVNEALKSKLNNLSYVDLRIPSRIFYKFK